MPRFTGTLLEQDNPAPKPRFSGVPLAEAPAASAAPAAAGSVGSGPLNAAPPSAPVDDWTHPTIIPLAKNKKTGEITFSTPQILKDVMDALKLPGDVYTGKTPVTDAAGNVTPDVIGRSFNLASLIMPDGVPRPSGALVDDAGRPVPKPVVRALRADGIRPQEAGQRVSGIGDSAVLADLGSNLRDQAAAVATTPGAGQKTIVDALSARRTAAPERLTGAIDENMGPATIPSYLQRDIKSGQRILGPRYDEVLANAPLVDTSPIAAQIEVAGQGLRGKAQSTLRDVRGMLNATGTDRLDQSPATLFQVRRAIDGMLNGETDGNVISALTPVRKSVDDLLAAKVPGIKAIDAQYAELARQGAAVDRGQTVLGNARSDPRPAELADEVAAGALPSGDLVTGPSGVSFRLRQGARAEIDRIVGTNLNDRAALNSLLKGNSDWNYQRLSTLFGKEKTDALYSILGNERVMAETENKALAGSKTAALTAAQKEINGPDVQPGAVRSALDLKFGTASSRVLDALFGTMAEKQRASRNAGIADALMSRGEFRDPGRMVPLPTAALMEAIFQSRASDRNGGGGF